MESNQTPYDRIGGVLILVAIMLILNPIRILYVILSVSFPAYQSIPESIALFEVVLNVVFLLYSLVVPVYFFQRRKSAPMLIIALFLFNMFFVAVNGTITQWLPSEIAGAAPKFRIGEFTIGAVWFLLWTVYFMISKRAKGTFIR
ncbi:DUF2569 domain-containing protein [bacterium]|nr:DUF2569 domain-containing protein [bacterium]